MNESIKKLLSKVKCIVTMLCIVSFIFLLYVLSAYFFPDYCGRIVTDNHISNAISIITTFIIGGCVILLVENQHIESEVTSRYYSIMRPFYKRLIAYSKFAQQCMFALSASDETGKNAKKKLQIEMAPIKRVASGAIMTGKDVFWLKAEFLENLCNRTNQIWYIFNRNHNWYSHLSFNNQNQINGIREALLEYDKNYSKENITLKILPEVSGDFFVKVWQPIDNVPARFDVFLHKCRECQHFVLFSFVVEISSLIIIYISYSISNISTSLVDSFVLFSMVSFLLGLTKLLQLKSSTLILQF